MERREMTRGEGEKQSKWERERGCKSQKYEGNERRGGKCGEQRGFDN